MTDLEKAAQAVLVRWDSPAWDWAHQGPTAALMADLRDALAAHREQAEPVESSAGAGGAGGWGEPVVWVGVTEVEVSDIYTRRAIEAVLKQKNAQQSQQAEPVAADCTPNHFCGYKWIHKPSGELCNRCGHD